MSETINLHVPLNTVKSELFKEDACLELEPVYIGNDWKLFSQ